MSALTVRITAPDGPVRLRVWPQQSPDGSSAAWEDEAAGSPTAVGSGTDPVLLACHGWTDSGEVFGPLAERLGRRWTVVAPDAPGHGETPLRPGDYRVAEHVVPVTAVLDCLPTVAGHARPVVVLGHSMGAGTAARLAAARPDVVAALVLEDPARTTLRRPGSVQRMRTWIRGLQSGDHASRVDWAAANHPDWPADELGPWARSKAEVDPAHLERPIDWGEPLPALLAEVRCPVLIVHGERERGGIVSPTAARRCAAACGGPAEVLAMPAGHCPRRERPRAFTAALSTVLEAVGAG